MKKVVFIFLAAIMLLAACKKDKNNIVNPDGTIDVQKISLTTITPTIGEENVITTGGKASIDLNGYSELDYGVCFGTGKLPTISNSIESGSSVKGEFYTVIDDFSVLTQTTYYFRAYVLNRNDGSVKYGNEVNVVVSPIVYDTKFINGKYSGTHHLNIPANILDALSATLPIDPVTGEPVDLSKGFVDTLDIRIVNDKVKITTKAFDVILEGIVTTSNTVKIPETKFDFLDFGPSITAENAALATNKDIKFTSATLGSATTIELRLKASKIGTFAIPLNITTTGTFVKIAN